MGSGRRSDPVFVFLAGGRRGYYRLNIAAYFYVLHQRALTVAILYRDMLFRPPRRFIYTFTPEMLYIPESDSCTVWTANNTPLQRDSETLYWFPSSANIDCWQVQPSHDGDASAWQERNGQKWRGTVIPLKCAVSSLGNASPVENVNPAYVNPCRAVTLTLPPPDATFGLRCPKTSVECVVGTGGTSGCENPEWIGSCCLCPSPPTTGMCKCKQVCSEMWVSHT